MANGTPALKLVPAPESKDTPAEATAIGVAIGPAMADSVEALGLALIDTESGAPLRAEIRTLNGEKLAQIVELQMAHLGEIENFAVVALAEGRRVLLERHRAGLHRQLGADVPEEAIVGCIDELCGWILTIAGRVTATEMAFRSN
jgi:hypothetical protein